MFFIPGFLITLCTFPGVIFHELGHKWFCHLTKVPVHEVCYFRLGDPSGYVIHEQPKKFSQSLLISVGPLISGTIIALIFFILAELSLSLHPLIPLFCLWMGVSIAVNAFPSSGDADSLWEEANRHIKDDIWAIFGYPVVVIIQIANLLNFFWFDFIYAAMLWILAKSLIQGAV